MIDKIIERLQRIRAHDSSVMIIHIENSDALVDTVPTQNFHHLIQTLDIEFNTQLTIEDLSAAYNYSLLRKMETPVCECSPPVEVSAIGLCMKCNKSARIHFNTLSNSYPGSEL